MTDNTIGTREEWLAAREQLLVREKEHTDSATSSRGSDASCRGCA
jgi:predicted dithiol-disulfide oxidoreductase (DUF899 family)